MESHRPNNTNPSFRRCPARVKIRENLPVQVKIRLIQCSGPATGFFLPVLLFRRITMKRIVSAFAALAFLALASTAYAQVQTGSILVRAVDEQGALMPGVTITLASPVLVAGTMTGVTDTGGVNRFPS